MQRHEWDFEYGAAKLSEAATKKSSHHAERLKWWEDQKAKVMAEVRESGIEVSESQAQQYSNASSRMGPEIMVRTDLQRKLTEVHQKIREHADKMREYDGWRQALAANPESRLKLHHDDWLFFFGE